MEDRFDQHVRSLIVKLLLDRTGQTLSDDRRYRVDRAIETVLANRGISRSADLIILLTQPDSAAVEQELLDALLNNETYFFRDRNVFNQLAERVLPDLARAKAASREIAIWSAGCSTGQEPLTLAMLFLSQGKLWDGWKVRIVATDISGTAITKARTATYSQFEIQRGLAVGQMLDHFEETPHGWRASDRLRAIVQYQSRNLLDGPPPDAPFDLILCRNVLLYFDVKARHRALSCLAMAMAPHSRLVLGGGEACIDCVGMFEPDAGDGSILRTFSPDLAAKADAA